MKAGSHLVVGAAAGWLAVWALQSAGTAVPADVFLAGPLVAALGALVPDIDHPGSTVSRRVPRRLTHWALRVAAPVGLVVAVSLALHQSWVAGKAAEAGEPLLRLAGLLMLPAVVIVAASLLASGLLGHRGATHSLLFALVAGAIVAAIGRACGARTWRLFTIATLTIASHGLLVLPAVVLVALSLLVSLLFGHRGATHSLAFAGGSSLLTAALCLRVGLSPWYGAFLGLGWLSHLAADSLGRRRLRALLWPLAGRR